MSFLSGRVHVAVGDLTRARVDAIVNAANSTLLGGGGVDGAIHRAGGPQILAECRELRRARYKDGLPTGEVAITIGGLLQARYVIHTVGPIWGQHEGLEAELLAACYRNSLALAAAHRLTSIAFPAISTGAYNYPRAEAAAVSSTAIQNFLREMKTTDSVDASADESKEARRELEEVRLVFFSQRDAETFLQHHRFDPPSA